MASVPIDINKQQSLSGDDQAVCDVVYCKDLVIMSQMIFRNRVKIGSQSNQNGCDELDMKSYDYDFEIHFKGMSAKEKAAVFEDNEIEIIAKMILPSEEIEPFNKETFKAGEPMFVMNRLNSLGPEFANGVQDLAITLDFGHRRTTTWPEFNPSSQNGKLLAAIKRYLDTCKNKKNIIVLLRIPEVENGNTQLTSSQIMHVLPLRTVCSVNVTIRYAIGEEVAQHDISPSAREGVEKAYEVLMKMRRAPKGIPNLRFRY